MSKVTKLTMVCVAMLAFTAFATSSAMAAGNWMVNGATLSAGQTKALATTAATEESAKLKAAGVTITCISKTLTGTGPVIEGGTEMGSAKSLTFNECSATAPCKVPTSISTTPILVTAQLLEAGNLDKVLLLFKPQTKTTFAEINFTGENCALEGNQPVTGKARVIAPKGGLEATLQLIEAAVTEAANELKVGSSAAELTGKANLQLATPTPWSFLLP